MEKNNTKKKQNDRQKPDLRRKPYEKPAIVEEDKFETYTLSCVSARGCDPRGTKYS
jgi:hypothetical protein